MRVVICQNMLRLVSFFFKQKTAYEMRISDWSSDVCSSDLARHRVAAVLARPDRRRHAAEGALRQPRRRRRPLHRGAHPELRQGEAEILQERPRSEEHTSELQSLMRSSYAVFCLQK